MVNFETIGRLLMVAMLLTTMVGAMASPVAAADFGGGGGDGGMTGSGDFNFSICGDNAIGDNQGAQLLFTLINLLIYLVMVGVLVQSLMAYMSSAAPKWLQSVIPTDASNDSVGDVFEDFKQAILIVVVVYLIRAFSSYFMGIDLSCVFWI